ncbi:MAG: nuclear transport factor 2 family protein [Dehalococcoidia bacterium]|nr:nuclear transport factor 2 family protein [Dehalococcoidia bacterium]
MSDYPYLDVLKRYYQGCSAGDVVLMKSAFAPNVVHYFPLRDPVRGADALAAHWLDLHQRLGATWAIDRTVVQGNEAVMEWTMRFIPRGASHAVLWRGVDWCVFHEGRISEIRAFYHHPIEPRITSELKDFPYRQRGYPTL